MAQQAIATRNEVLQGLQITSGQVLELLCKGRENTGRNTNRLKHGPFYADGSNAENFPAKLPLSRSAIDTRLHQPWPEHCHINGKAAVKEQARYAGPQPIEIRHDQRQHYPEHGCGQNQ